MPLIGNALKSLTNSVSIPLGITAAVSAIDAAIHKKMFRSGRPHTLSSHPSDLASRMAILIISNEEMNDIMKIVKSLERSGSWIKGVSETIKNETKGQKRGFLSMFLGRSGANLLGNLFTGKGTIRAGEGRIRAGQDF